VTTPTAQLAELADEYFALFTEAAPVAATMYGIPGHDDAVPDVSESAQADIARRMANIRDRTDALDADQLTDTERTTRALLRHECQAMINAHTSHELEWAIGRYAGPISMVLSAVPKVLLTDDARAADYYHRCAKLPAYLEQWVDRLRDGRAQGFVPNRRSVELALGQLDGYLASSPGDDPLLAPCQPAEHARVRAKLTTLVAERMRPAMARIRQLIHDELLPAARPDTRCGVMHLPNGPEIYLDAVRQHTTTERTPHELHETGLRLGRQVREELRSVGVRVFGTDEFTEIIRLLREDPGLRYATSDEIVRDATGALRRAEEALPDWFGRWHRAPCEIGQMNAVEGATAVPGYYQPPGSDGSRPGRFWVNTSGPGSRCRHETEALTFHESVPGHHLQFAVAQELTGLPEFRRFAYVSAFGEGWGLYAERLADEMGLYSDDRARLGMLSFDAMRAARLVVDTGIHAAGWSRDRAIDYMWRHTAVPMGTIVNEVDRYINWPGQALAYMTGRLEIDALRETGRAELGSRFQLKEFHDALLGAASIPLSELRVVLHRWAASRDITRSPHATDVAPG